MGGSIRTEEIKAILRVVTSSGYIDKYIKIHFSDNDFDRSFTDEEDRLNDNLKQMTSHISRFEQSLGKKRPIRYYEKFISELKAEYTKEKLFNIVSHPTKPVVSKSQFEVFWNHFEKCFLKVIYNSIRTYIYKLTEDKFDTPDEYVKFDLYNYIIDCGEFEEICDYYSQPRIIKNESVTLIEKDELTQEYKWIGRGKSKLPPLAELINYLNQLGKLKQFDTKKHQAKCFFDFFHIEANDSMKKYLPTLLIEYSKKTEFDKELAVYFKDLESVIFKIAERNKVQH